MGWIAILALQVTLIASGIRDEQRAGQWSWSKFIFALAFGLLESCIIVVPFAYIDPHTRYFLPICVAACTFAVLNFIWFIIVMRRWRLPDGRTSLQAYRDKRHKLRGPN